MCTGDKIKGCVLACICVCMCGCVAKELQIHKSYLCGDLKLLSCLFVASSGNYCCFISCKVISCYMETLWF
jgi:hypothetical protein